MIVEYLVGFSSYLILASSRDDVGIDTRLPHIFQQPQLESCSGDLTLGLHPSHIEAFSMQLHLAHASNMVL